MRMITREEMESLPSYPHIEQAITFSWSSKYGHHGDIDSPAGGKNSPWVRKGGKEYFSKRGLYNMSTWANWKSSSLGNQERAEANAIDNLPLYQLMKLNEGRRMNEPCLFPEGDLLGEGK